jgi:exoribonuclease R
MDAANLEASSTAGGSGACTGGQSQNETPSGRDKEKRHRNRKKTPSQGTPQNVPAAGTPSSRPHRSRKNSPFNAKMDPPFEDYWDKEAVQRGLKLKKLIQGVLRINQRNYEDAYVDDPEGGGDYYVSGIHRRNRALDGDVVVLEVLPTDKWLDEERLKLAPEDHKPSTLQDMAPSLDTLQASVSKGETASAKDYATDGPSTDTTVDAPCSTATLVDRLYNVPDSMKVGREEEEGEPHRRYQRELMNYRRTAKVVYIVERGHSRTVGGHLKAFDKVVYMLHRFICLSFQ